jgi:GWxTD domain-containing protein
MASLAESSSTDWIAIAFAAYAVVAGAFLVRLLIGVWRGARVCGRAVGLNDTWTKDMDVRVSDDIRFPATIGTTVLFPRDWTEWNTFERTAILAHESFHVQRRDFHVRTLAGLHRAIFWFSPLAWWLERQLMELSERICDDAAIRHGEDRVSYAEILVRLAGKSARQEFIGVSMARGETVAGRVERILRETKLAREISPGSRVVTLAAILPLVVFASSGWLVAKAAPIAVVLVRQQPLPPQSPQPPQPPQRQAQPATSPAQANRPAEATQYLAGWAIQEVPYIISDAERFAFERLRTDEEREMFIQVFWQRKDPTPGTSENEFRDEYYRRIVLANQKYTTGGTPGWKTDRGRILIRVGQPDEIETHAAGGTYIRSDTNGAPVRTTTFPFERWRYRFIDGIGNNVILEFVDKDSSGEYRLEYDPQSGLPKLLSPNN